MTELGEHGPLDPPVADCDCHRCALAARNALRRFAAEVMLAWPEGGLEGADLQDAAEKHGLLQRTEQTVPCGEYCGCAEFYAVGDTADCYRRTALLTG